MPGKILCLRNNAALESRGISRRSGRGEQGKGLGPAERNLAILWKRLKSLYMGGRKRGGGERKDEVPPPSRKKETTGFVLLRETNLGKREKACIGKMRESSSLPFKERKIGRCQKGKGEL